MDSNRWLFNRWTLVAAPLGIAVYLLPFVLAAERTGSRIALEMVWRENVRRFVAPHNHVGPVYLYLGVILVLAAPWSAFLPAALVPPRPVSRGDRLARAYFWAVFVFFTASASRRSYYLLPVLPAAALLIGRVLTAEHGELSALVRRLRIGGWWALDRGSRAGGRGAPAAGPGAAATLRPTAAAAGARVAGGRVARESGGSADCLAEVERRTRRGGGGRGIRRARVRLRDLRTRRPMACAPAATS